MQLDSAAIVLLRKSTGVNNESSGDVIEVIVVLRKYDVWILTVDEQWR